MLKFCSVASGSSGNSYIIMSENTVIVHDAGVSAKRICAVLGDCGKRPEDVDAIMITHEHSDHIKGLSALAKRAPNAEIYASAGSWRKLRGMRDFILLAVSPTARTVSAGDKFSIGDINLSTAALSHDAEEGVCFSYECGGSRLSIITDTGTVTAEIYREIRKSRLLVIEANYEEEVLDAGRYPYWLKQRIKSVYGHLSNIDAARAIADIVQGAPPFPEFEPEREELPEFLRKPGKARGDGENRVAEDWDDVDCDFEGASAGPGARDDVESEGCPLELVLLAHLSKENNTPDLAYQTVQSYLDMQKDRALSELEIDILLRDVPSALYIID